MSRAAPRDAVIDSLRGVAIGLVLLLHFSLAFGVSDSALGDWLGRPALRTLVRSGNFGVTLFFVLSGYLITAGLLARHGELARLDLHSFYVQRAGRILPPLLLALAVIVPLGLMGLPHFDNSDGGVSRPASFWWPAVGSVLGFWHNQLMQHEGYFNYCLNVYWSLSVEEVFYLGFPLLCLALQRPPRIAAACGLLVLLGPVYRAAHTDNEIAYLYAYPACFDAIAVGCLTAMACARWTLPTPWARVLAPLAALAMGATYVRGFADDPVFSFTLLALSSALFIAATRGSPARDPGQLFSKASAPLRWLGRHSYELYLFHVIVLAGLRQFISKASLTHDQRLPLLLAFLLVCAVLAGLIARGFSEPINRRWRLRWSSSP